MNFVLVAISDNSSFLQRDDGGETVLLAHIGYFEDDNSNVFAKVGLSPCSLGGFEYFFGLDRYFDAHDVTTYHSGVQVQHFFTIQQRRQILDLICFLTEELLSSVRPELVFRVTHDSDLPMKALEKHDRISNIFSEAGYKVTQTDDYYGKRAWWMSIEQN